MKRRRFAVGLAALVAARPALAADDPQKLIDELNKGGFIIYFRHGETGSQGADRAPDMADCSTQRNLNDAGRAQVRQLGEDFRALGIPVGKVLSSAWCRCWQHAEAMFGKGGYQISELVSLARSYPAVTDADRELKKQQLRALLIEVPPAGRNTVLISHGNNVLMLTGYHPNTQGEAAASSARGRRRSPRDSFAPG
ncbi:MAG: histidine phosphatase family protein [Acidimicrobiia bacterium]